MDNNLQQFARQYMDRQNNRPIPEFEGYSPNEMQYLLHDPFGPESPLKLNVLDEADYRLIPMLNMIRYLGRHLKKTGEMKLTAKGFLPVKIVADLYEQGFYKEEMIESGIVKLYKQTDSHSIDLAGRLSDISGLTKKRNNKLSLTKNGEKLLGNNAELLRLLLSTFGYKFNWAYYDGYESERIGQIGFAFSLVLLKRYGDKKRRDTFYAQKYFRAFPDLYEGGDAQNEIEENPWNPARNCYFIRTFERFLHLFGLVEIEKEKVSMKEQWSPEKHYITRTALFHRLISCAPHRKFPSGHVPPGVPKINGIPL